MTNRCDAGGEPPADSRRTAIGSQRPSGGQLVSPGRHRPTLRPTPTRPLRRTAMPAAPASRST